MAPENWTTSCIITGRLVPALRGQEEFQTADHSACLREVRTAVHKRNVLLAEEALVDIVVEGAVQGARQLRHVVNTGAWITVQPSTVNETELGV